VRSGELNSVLFVETFGIAFNIAGGVGLLVAAFSTLEAVLKRVVR
jgi:hypothetical protein